MYMLLILGLLFIGALAQDVMPNPYGLKVIADTMLYRLSVQHYDGKPMADVKKIIPGIRIELRYADTNNFLGKKIYPQITTAYLRKAAAIALSGVQKDLKRRGLALKIFDAYRPYSATEIIWQQVQDERYAASPAKGSGHNRGIAVDVTIIRLDNGAELDMGTGFDDFTDTAQHSFKALPQAVLHNRQLLKTMMAKYGFEALETEWWHYAFTAGKNYDLLDVPFDFLERQNINP
jgi:zinc D-Ala-D-Ala dipeptidase